MFYINMRAIFANCDYMFSEYLNSAIAWNFEFPSTNIAHMRRSGAKINQSYLYLIYLEFFSAGKLAHKIYDI